MGIDPISLAALGGLALSGVGAVTSAVGAGEQASANADAYRYQSQVAENNKILAQQNAKTAEAEGAAKSAVQGLQAKAKLGGILAAQSASGVDVNSGSAVDVRTSQSELNQMDALTIRADAARKAYGYETQANSFGAQSTLDTASADSAGTAGDFAIGSTLLSGASSLGNSYAKWQQVGGGNSGASGYTDAMGGKVPGVTALW